MKTLTRVTLSFLAALFCARAALAQDAPAPLKFAPAGEGFAVEMPRQPSSSPERVAAEGLAVAGRRYEAADESGRRYVVWSLNDPFVSGRQSAGVNKEGGGRVLGLDMLAEVAWQLLVAPEIERVKAEKVEDSPRLSYAGEFSLDGKRAREYTFTSKRTDGPVFICADGPRVYVVAALGEDSLDPRLKQFVQSFRLRADAPDAPSDRRPAAGIGSGTGSGMGVGIGAGSPSGGGGAGTEGGPVDYDRTFKQSEVTKKAVITGKPEPAFTEQGRRFNVNGVVRLRVVLNKTGGVTNISVVKPLPHGLTEKAIAAARGITFEPAQKDGRTVSQYVVLEYNFNIY
ncbi:MAG TPA: energy transducer TonB [Pyrinomonadaceae bacterium]|nr:energy transducer TonB [Pyrinomonadaceae bacterium]